MLKYDTLPSLSMSSNKSCRIFFFEGMKNETKIGLIQKIPSIYSQVSIKYLNF